MATTRSIRTLTAFTLGVTLTLVLGACGSPGGTPEASRDAAPTPAPRETPTGVLDLPGAAQVSAQAYNPTDLRETEDPGGLVYGASLDGGKIVRFAVGKLPQDAYSTARPTVKKIVENTQPAARDKLHPLVREWVLKRAPTDRVRVLVNFRDDLTIPRFPEPAVAQARTSDTNLRAQERANTLVRQIQARRAVDYDGNLRPRLAQYGAKVVDQFWLIRGLVVDLPVGSVRALADAQDVLSIEPRLGGERPPVDDVSDGRARIVSDPYFDLGLRGGFIGLLDTGVRATHQLLSGPSNVAIRQDMTGGLDPNDDCWNHGTSSAAIISGNGNQGNAFRGVTGVWLDSFKVYPAGCGGLDSAAAVQGFQRAVQVLDRVIVAEMQSGGDDLSSISTAADNAFDAGAVVIAANGNFGPGAGTVSSPANAHRVLGIGALDVVTLAQQDYQGRGPTRDNRYKPDLQAPTNTETASSASDTARRVFGGTSGSTPYGAGAAALMRNWLRGSAGTIDPGQVYAHLILSGQRPWPFDNTVGAGRIRLPTGGVAFWGKVTLGPSGVVDIPIPVGSAGWTAVEGALWWPERATGVHNDVDLQLVDPSGAVRASSTSAVSVFERARAAGPVGTGTWKLRIRAYSVSGSQDVYWGGRLSPY
ncbi:S8 family peptidase [Deinococcus pimensis]|uniref:S8 family peptidase n=1 Tax=Deinococcus pimensis TaxID=309888 RepID=UPI0004BAE497|nr:S8 family serine peptidase [Deinococcus pimensis]